MAVAKSENSGWARLAESVRQSEFVIPPVSMFPNASQAAPEPAAAPEPSHWPVEPKSEDSALPARPEPSFRPPTALIDAAPPRIEPERTAPPPIYTEAPAPSAPSRAAAGDRLTFGIVGCGTVGRSIAQLAAAAGHPVLIYDADPRAVEAAVQTIGNLFRRAVDRGQVPFNVADAAIARVKGVPDINALAPVGLVIEAVGEDVELKRAVLTRLEPMVREDTIFATHTSSFPVAAIASACKHPERFAGLHFLHPVPITRVVEVVRAPRTADRTIERLTSIVARLNQTPILVEDTPGFVINAAGRGFFAEALRILEEGVAAPHAIDTAVREVLGFRSGPFEMLDQNGLDNVWATQQQLFEQFFGEPRLRPVPLVAQRIAAGLLGRKTNAGFYQYNNGEIIRPQPDPPPNDVRCPIWVSGARPPLASKVAAALTGAAEIVSGPPLPNNAAIVVTPLGLDATQAATEEKLDPRRVVAVDALFALDRHVVMMGTPVTDQTAIDAVRSAFVRAKRQVTVIADCPGFIAQRIAAMIVAIGCAMVERGVASAADIDRGVTMALGYPLGPLALGDRLGPRVVVEILQNMWRATGDPRWRIPGWLRRRALLATPLAAAAPSPK